jgi:hypothetical protein
METKPISELSNEELIKEHKKSKNEDLIRATFIGVLIGVFIFALFKSGIKFTTFLPLVIIYFFIKGKKSYRNYKELDNEIKTRNL